MVVAPPINERELRVSHDHVCYGNSRETASPTHSKLTHYYNRLKEREGEGGRRERERKRERRGKGRDREKEREEGERERQTTDKYYAIIPVSMLVGMLVQK